MRASQRAPENPLIEKIQHSRVHIYETQQGKRGLTHAHRTLDAFPTKAKYLATGIPQRSRADCTHHPLFPPTAVWTYPDNTTIPTQKSPRGYLENADWNHALHRSKPLFHPGCGAHETLRSLVLLRYVDREDECKQTATGGKYSYPSTPPQHNIKKNGIPAGAVFSSE